MMNLRSLALYWIGAALFVTAVVTDVRVLTIPAAFFVLAAILSASRRRRSR